MGGMELTLDKFKAKALRCDVDALILYAIGIVGVVAFFASLAFLPDAAWERLVDRSRLLGWLIMPVVAAALGRFGVRIGGVLAAGRTSAAVAPEIARAEVYANAAAASVQRDELDAFEPDEEDIAEAQAFHAHLAADPTQNGPILPRGDDA